MTSWRTQLGLVATVFTFLPGCGTRAPSGGSKPTPPAKVAQAVTETKLNTVTLTEEAEKRVGLTTAPVEEHASRRMRAFAGEVMLPTNAVLTVAAPVSGTLKVVDKHKLPQVGSTVKQGEAMFTLLPHVLTQAERVSLATARLQLAQTKIDAEGQVKQAQVQVEAAKIAFDRAERLYREQADTKKTLDDALAQFQLAEKVQEAALLKKRFVDSMELDTEAGTVKPVVIPAPRSGIVRATFAVPGETVPAGASLFEIMNVDTLWIRVPVYVGEAADIADKEPARIQNLADTPGAKGVMAKPIAAPPTAQAQASAVDLYYELANAKGTYRPGQRVSALLALQEKDKSLALPWSAVVHDINGGMWVYVQVGERTYARQRIQVRYVADGWAVLAEGPQVGAKVVTAGAAEVFGAEFGFGK